MNTKSNVAVTTEAPKTETTTVDQIAVWKKKYGPLDEQVKKLGSKSAVVRQMKADGLETKDIAKVTGMIYQHVRNVLITPVKAPAAPKAEVKTEAKVEAPKTEATEKNNGAKKTA
jgi:hypothetical protein